MSPTPVIDMADYLQRKIRRLEKQLTHAVGAATFRSNRYRGTISRYGPPPDDLVNAIRDEAWTRDVQLLVTLASGCRIIALLDGIPHDPDPFAEAEVWRHLNELAARMAATSA